MKKEEKNYFGKSKPSGFLMENFYMKKEDATGKLKFEHKSGDFSFRIWAGAYLDGYYETLKQNADNASAILSGIKTFTIMSIQEPKFFADFTLWFKDYMEVKMKEVSEEQHKADLDKVKQDIETGKEMINYEVESIGATGDGMSEVNSGGMEEASASN